MPSGWNYRFGQCVSRTSLSSEIASTRPWSAPTARCPGAACRASTRRRCSRRCSTAKTAANSRFGPAATTWALSATSTTPTSSRRPFAPPTGRSASSISRRGSSVRPQLPPDDARPHRSSRSRACRACASAAIPASAGRRRSRRASRARTTSTTKASPIPLRLTTDVPLSYLNGQPFSLSQPHHMVLTWGATGRGSRCRRSATAS